MVRTENATVLYWYAYRVYHNKMKEIKETVVRDGFSYYIPMRPVRKDGTYNMSAEEVFSEEPVIPSLIFIHSTKEYMQAIRRNPYSRIGVYCNPGTDEPSAIPDKEMDIFIFVTSRGCQAMESIDVNFTKGDRVRITGGILEGAEGYITRVHGTKRFVVTIEGVAAIATAFIPRHFIEKIS